MLLAAFLYLAQIFGINIWHQYFASTKNAANEIAAFDLMLARIGVVGCARLELATNGLKVRCSTD
jgi:hypothetical protein